MKRAASAFSLALWLTTSATVAHAQAILAGESATASGPADAAVLAQNVTLPGHVVEALANATRIPHTPQMDVEPITITASKGGSFN